MKSVAPATKTNWPLARRELLKGLGIGAACLPLLPSTKSFAQAGGYPKRLMMVLLTEGYRPGMVAPAAGPLANQTLPAVTTPLEKHKNDLIILTNLNNPQFLGCDRWGHGTYGTIFAQDRGDPKTGNGKEYWEPLNPTMDQVIAKQISKGDLVPSLHTSVRVGTNSGGTGSNRCFYSAAVTPITPEADPYKLYNMLIAGKSGPMDDPNADKLRAQRKSLLDYVGKSLTKFGNQLGREGKTMVGTHLESIKQLENTLTAPRMPGGACTVMSGDLSKPVDIGNNGNNGVLLNAHFQIMAAALKCGITKVATMQFGDATGGSVTFPQVNVNRNWHSLGHNPGADKVVVDKWVMTQFAGLLDLLKGIPEGTETMLDHMTLLWANHMESGDTHGARKLPWIISGKCNGFWKLGQSVPSSGKNNTHVMATICNAMGVPVEKFGDGVPMPELKA